MKRLFVVRVNNITLCERPGQPLYFESKMAAKRERDRLGTLVGDHSLVHVAPGPDHKRGTAK